MRSNSDSLATLTPDERRKLLAQLLRRGGGPRICPLSFSQQPLWVFSRMLADSNVYNIGSAARLIGPLDARAVERTIGEIARRHSILRTTFHCIDGEPVQIVHASVEHRLQVIDLSNMSPAERDEETQRVIAEENGKPFDLDRGPLLRAALVKLKQDEHVFVMSMHHIICDGWSLGLFIHEMGVIYSAYLKGERSPLPELPLQYADYASWQREHLRGGALEDQLTFWRHKLAGLSSLPKLADRDRPPVASYKGAVAPMRLPMAVLEGIKALGREERASPFMVLLAALQALLYRLTGAEDIAVGTDSAGRDRQELEGLIGLFVNQLVLRTVLSASLTFRELLKRVRSATLEAYAHQELPYEKLVEALRPERDGGGAGLFQVKLVFHNMPKPAFRCSNIVMQPMTVNSNTAKRDLTIFLWETDEGLEGSLKYSTDLFDEHTANTFLSRFATILQSAIGRPEARLDELEIVGEDEKDAKARERKTRQEHNLRRLKSTRPTTLTIFEEQ